MTTKPRILDTFSGAGGCSRGYQDAGFEVIGCDINHQPRYIGSGFYQGDALELLRLLVGGGSFTDDRDRVWWLEDFDAIHTSPPCQAYTNAQRIHGNNHPDLIAPVRELLQVTGKPYIIENVPGAPLINPTLLTGTMFGLMTVRPRLFETNFELPFLMESPRPKQIKMGRSVQEGDYIQLVGNFSNVPYARRAMGIDWMIRTELSQAIPPAYTKFIGQRLLEAMPTANR